MRPLMRRYVIGRKRYNRSTLWYKKYVSRRRSQDVGAHSSCSTELNFHNILLFTSASLVNLFHKAVDDLLEFILTAFEIVF